MADLFGKLKKNIQGSIDTVSEKSSLLIETTKLKSQIGKLEEQKEHIFTELGSCVYSMFRVGSMDEQLIEAKCAEIKAVAEAIIVKMEELKKLADDKDEKAHAPKKCECGADLQPDSKFCMNCGKRVGD